MQIEQTKPLPWFLNKDKINKDKAEYIQYYQDKDISKCIEDLVLPASYHISEIIHSEDKPPQVRLQACQLVLNKVIGDKIDIHETKTTIDVNKLLDQLSGLHHATMQPIDITEDKGNG